MDNTKHKYNSCEQILTENNDSYHALDIAMIKYIFYGETDELFEIYNSLILLHMLSKQ